MEGKKKAWPIALVLFGLVAGGAARAETIESAYSCADVVTELRNQMFVDISGNLVSLTACPEAPTVIVRTFDAERCISVSWCGSQASGPRRPTSPPAPGYGYPRDGRGADGGNYNQPGSGDNNGFGGGNGGA